LSLETWRKIMRFAIKLAALAAMVATTSLAAPASALPVTDGLRATIDGLAAVETVQFRYRGRNHCWAERGWHGPGWYWCGYENRRGRGWGGPRGWRGWRHPGWR
jgi:hypothetical protein